MTDYVLALGLVLLPAAAELESLVLLDEEVDEGIEEVEEVDPKELVPVEGELKPP